MIRDAIARLGLGALAGALGELQRNDHAWSYTIPGFDGSPYINRTLLPRVLGHRALVHKIHRGDADRWLHNHPWRTAKFLIACGGYVEERLVDGVRVERELAPGNVNELDASTFHRVLIVKPNTWTIGIVGERCQEWGFLVDDREFVRSADYFARQRYVSQGVDS